MIIGIFLVTVILWLMFPIEIGSIFCIGSLMLVPGLTPNFIIQNSFGNQTIVFLLFSFLLTFGLSYTGILRKIAIVFITNPIAQKSERNFFLFFLLVIFLIGCIIAPTTLFILAAGLIDEIGRFLNREKGDLLMKHLMIGTGFVASISCAATPIAHTFPIMALGFYEEMTGLVIPYGIYLKYSLPIGILLFILTCGILSVGLNTKNTIYFSDGSQEFRWNFKTVSTLVIFLMVVLYWIIIGIWPSIPNLGNIFPAIVGCILMVIVGGLDLKQGLKHGVSWSALLLCAATFALGKVLTMDEFGVLSRISAEFGHVSLFLIICFSVILTNIISNIVTTTVAFNLFILALNFSQPIIGTIAIGIGASLAYTLPSSIAHIALAGSSGWATNKDMLKYGSIMTVMSILIMSGIMYLF